MNDPLRPDDELVSAVLDGEATEAERARVAADPALAARLAELAAVRDAVGAPVPPPDPDRREAALAAALAATLDAAGPGGPAGHEPPDDTDDTDDGAETVVPLRRAASRAELPRFLAVAAAVLVALLAAGVLADRLGDGGTDTAARDDTVARDDTADTMAESTGGAAPPLAADEAGPPPDLGVVLDDAGLRAALERDAGLGPGGADGDEAGVEEVVPDQVPPDDPAAESGGPVAGDSDECQADLEEADPALSGLLFEATVVYGDTPAVVYVFATVDAGRRVVVVEAASCQVRSRFDW